MNRIYLDANGSCPPLSAVIARTRDALNLCGNPSSFHQDGQRSRALIDEARLALAKELDCSDKNIIFTSGASEANRLFVDALKKHARDLAKKLTVLSSPFEHPSLLKPLIGIAEDGHIELNFLAVNDAGSLSLPGLGVEDVDVFICTQSHNETGIVPDLANFCQALPPTTLVMSDVSQALARLPLPPKRVDFITFSGQKMGALPGIGCAIIRQNAKSLPSPWQGGGQERGMRPGTESTVLIAGLSEAAKNLTATKKANQQLGAVRDYFEAELKKYFAVTIIGESVARISNTTAATFHDTDPDALRIKCDLAGLSVGFGSACSGLAPEGSFALKRIGLDLTQEKSTVRFSFAPGASLSDASETIRRLRDMVLNH